MNLKQIVLDNLNRIGLSINFNNLEKALVENIDEEKGDVSLPCFALSKELRLSPVVIAQNLSDEINEKIKDSIIIKTVAVNGYLNIYLDKDKIAKDIVKEVVSQKENFGNNDMYKGKTVVLDYSSVNLAKYMHIGHLKTTIIGLVMKNIYKTQGYKTVSINYVGDYGTPYGMMITAYKHWGNIDEINKNGVDAIQDLYVRFNKEAVDNPALLDEARMWFKKIEDRDKEAVELSKWIIEICRSEVERLCDILGAKFDSWRGESYYSDKMQNIIDELQNKGLTKISQGALVVDLEKYNLGVALIRKSDGTSLYLTRDLAAIDDRYNMYKFDKAVYVTDVSQKLHFQQLFKIVQLLDRPYANNLEHIAYGRYSMPDGRISSRLGKQALLKDLLQAAEGKSIEIMKERGTKVDNIEKASEKVAVGAISFEATKNEKIKDTIYDMEASLNFDGETSPYMQYTFARCCSILEKANTTLNIDDVKLDNIKSETGYNLIKLINKFPSVVIDAGAKSEPCLLVRNLMDIAKEFNKFYTLNRIIDNSVVNIDNLAIVVATKQVLENGFKIVNIPIIEKM